MFYLLIKYKTLFSQDPIHVSDIVKNAICRPKQVFVNGVQVPIPTATAPTNLVRLQF